MELKQQAKFDQLVHQLERSTRQRRTNNHQIRLVALAAIGYGYIAIICLGLFSSLWLVRWLVELIQHHPIEIDARQLWVLFGLLAISTFWVQSTPLNDREIHRTEFPELFNAIDELSVKLKTPKIHHVVINADHNAAVYQTPQFGLQEWHRNYLVLGLPLLQSLTPEQFKATLAHELAHLSNNDSSFTGYILRVRQMWEQLTSDNNLFIFHWFFRWYEPLIKAYSFVSVRDREYAADALAQRMTSPEIAAGDLIQTYIYQHYLQEVFSHQLDRQARESETPPADVVSQMLASLRQPLDPQTTQIWLGLLLGQATDTDDTHPCLSDRLASVGYPTPTAWLPAPILCTAAEHFFGDRLTDLASELDLRWQKSQAQLWSHQYHQARYQQEYLDILTAQATNGYLTLGEATIQADLTRILRDELIALPLWQAILDRDPNHPDANYHVGKTMLDRGHPTGCEYLDRAIALDPNLVIPSCEELYRFHTFHGNTATAAMYLAWRQQHLPKQWRSKLERNIKDTDQFVTHDLAPEIITEICNKLINSPIIEQAYLVCKPMQVFVNQPLYILGIKIANPKSTNRHKLQGRIELEYELIDRLEIELGFVKELIIMTSHGKKSLATSYQDLKIFENIQKTPSANIY